MPRNRLTPLARTNRQQHYAAEDVLWRELRNRKLGGWKWKRQVPRGDYILDFYCAEAALVVELDGWSHELPGQAERDARRTARLEEQGLTVLRIQNRALWDGMEAVLLSILEACGGEAPHPDPLPAPRGEGG